MPKSQDSCWHLLIPARYLLSRGGLAWSPTAHNFLTRPTPVALERDLLPSDHCFIVGVP